MDREVTSSYETMMAHYTQLGLSECSALPLDALWECISGELWGHTQNKKILVWFHSHNACGVEVFSYAGTVSHSDCNGNHWNCYHCHMVM